MNNATGYNRSLLQELRYYIRLALPMMLSFATEPVMQFFDRLFLSHYKEGLGEIYISASFAGGLTASVILVFFTSIIGYTNTVVAQYYGAQKMRECGRITLQSLLLSVYVYPVLLVLVLFLQPIFSIFGHEALQEQLEVEYSRILLMGGIFALIQSGIGGFFIGIGKTRTVLFSSMLAMCLNIPFNYMFIYGFGIIPSMGIKGAAYGTILSSALSLTALFLYYWSNHYHAQFNTRISFKLHKDYMLKLIRYGLPAGIEAFMSVGVFSFFIFAMSSYGSEVGAAVTIAINWDSMSFIPILGASFATTAIVGQYMGAKDIKSVIRVIKIAAVLTMLFVGAMVLVFLCKYDVLINMFIDKMAQKQEVYNLAKIMVQTISVYVFAAGLSLVLSSVLRGAGDTRAMMIVYIIVDVLFATVAYLYIFSQKVSPFGAWIIFIGFPIAICIGVFIRFRQGKWKLINMVE